MNINKQKAINGSEDDIKLNWWDKLKNKLVIKANRGTTFKSYHAIPKSEREWLGLYMTPNSYLVEDFESLFSGSSKYRVYWKENYPIQYFIRNDFCDFFLYRTWELEAFWRKVKLIFRSENSRHNNLIPKEYSDDTHLIGHVITQLFKNFENELEAGIVDWEAMEHTNEFKQWYIKTRKRIDKVLPYIEERENKALDKWADNRDCRKQELVPDDWDKTKGVYALRFTQYWEDTHYSVQTKILKEIIEKRNRFWT